MSLWTSFVNVVLRGKNKRETNFKLQWDGGRKGQGGGGGGGGGGQARGEGGGLCSASSLRVFNLLLCRLCASVRCL